MAWIPAAIGLVSGFLGGGRQNASSSAADAAAGAQTTIANTQKDIVNLLMQQFGDIFQPILKAAGGQFGELAGLPTGDVAKYVVSSLLDPSNFRNVDLNQLIQGLGMTTDEALSKFKREDVGEGQRAGLVKSLGEQAIQSAAVMNIQENQRQDQRRQDALGILAKLLGGAGQFGSLGYNLTGQSQNTLAGLSSMYGAAGANAARAAGGMDPWSGLAKAIAQMSFPGGSTPATGTAAWAPPMAEGSSYLDPNYTTPGPVNTNPLWEEPTYYGGRP